MIDQIEKNKCNGCKMCKDICPVHAITYVIDAEGFWYPNVDYEKCVKCELCIRHCPEIQTIQERTRMPDVFAAWSVNDEVRLGSTSGGIFYELAKKTLDDNGFVIGCVYDADFKGARHIAVDTIDDLKPLMVSKYVQSDTENIYRQTREKIDTGKPVLFVGSPCQCAALVSFLDAEYDNLLICDFICRGTNSPKAHKKYVEYLEKKYGGTMINLRSKDKRNGWNHFGQSAQFSNGQEYYAGREEDLRIVAYHHGNLMMRDSCHQCAFKHIPRDGSDITLADFWGISPDEVDDIEKGISLIMTNTDKGQNYFLSLDGNVKYKEKTLSDALHGNAAIFDSIPRGANRDKFLQELDSLPFDELVEKYKDKKPNLIVRFERRIKNLLGILS